jgi:hypothetical protein
VPFGSGLNTLSNFPYAEAQFKRVKWETCSTFEYVHTFSLDHMTIQTLMSISNSSADCLTPKGFTWMRVQLTPTQSFDAVNMHADAGYFSLSPSLSLPH